MRRLIREETKEIMATFSKRIQKIEEKGQQTENVPNERGDRRPTEEQQEGPPPPKRRPTGPPPRRPPARPPARPPVRPPPRLPPRPPPKCFNCGKMGHIARNCYNWRPRRIFRNPPTRQPFRQYQHYPANTYTDPSDRYRTTQTFGPNGEIRITPIHQQHNIQPYQQEYHLPQNQTYERRPPSPFYQSIPPIYF